MQRALCWATAVDVNVTAASSSTEFVGSGFSASSASMGAQPATIVTAAQLRTLERAFLAFIKSSRVREIPRSGASRPRAIIAGAVVRIGLRSDLVELRCIRKNDDRKVNTTHFPTRRSALS